MPNRTEFLSRLLGFYCTLIGAAMLLRGDSTVQVVQQIVQDAALMYVLGILLVMAGLAMVLAHNVWSGGPHDAVLALIGWLTLLKGLLFILLPPETEGAFFLDALHYGRMYRFYACASIALGIYLCWAGWRRTPPGGRPKG